MRIKRTLLILFFGVILGFGGLSGEEKKVPDFSAEGFIEVGMDSVERGFYRPRFRFDFPFGFAALGGWRRPVFSQLSDRSRTRTKRLFSADHGHRLHRRLFYRFY